MDNFSMCASHSRGKSEEDIIFGISAEAGLAVKKFGKENIVNATIGAIMDEDEALSTLPTVDRIFKEIPSQLIAAYAPIEGLPEYLKNTIGLTFFDNRPDAYIDSVATPGGSGAISLTVKNYSEEGDLILTSDWFWGPYSTIAKEHRREVATFNLFKKSGSFDIEDFEKRLNEILRKQDSVLVILNSPAHNPTGFSMTYKDWNKTIDIIKNVDSNKKVTLLVDIAYIDYCGEKNEVRKFMKLFGGLPKNILTVIAFSISKSYLMYGLRTGAVIGISSSKSVIQEFRDIMQYSCRGIWSNCNRSGMELVMNIAKLENFAKVAEERENLRKLIDDRSSLFIKELKENNIEICPYSAGFFISIPHSSPMDIVQKLKQQKVFAVPLQKGVRFAVCAIPTVKIKGLASKIKKCI